MFGGLIGLYIRFVLDGIGSRCYRISTLDISRSRVRRKDREMDCPVGLIGGWQPGKEFMFADRIIKFGRRFEGRLDSDRLQGALDYVAHSEESLAFEILCDHICEYDISITDEEYSEAVRLTLDIGLDLGEGPFKHLLGLKK